MPRKWLDFKAEIFAHTLGITCVENHYMAVLIQQGFPYPCLFFQNFQTVDKTIHDFIHNKESYIAYRGMKRLHEIGSELGILETTHIRNLCFDEMIYIFNETILRNIPLLVRVDPFQLPRMVGVPWREDHYIMLIGKDHSNYVILDDYPRRMLSLSETELKNAFRSEVIQFGEIHPMDWDKYFQKVKEYVGECEPSGETELKLIFNENLTTDDLLFIRDAIGIHRMSRKRLQAWGQWMKENSNLMSENMLHLLKETSELTDKLYAMLEFFRLRKKLNLSSLEQITKTLLEKDNEWIRKTKEAIKQKKIVLKGDMKRWIMQHKRLWNSF